MPKERILSLPIDDTLTPIVQITWGRDSEHVQLATLNSDGVELEPTPEGNGWFVSLSRNGINQMIRILRRARDQAYGRDE